MKKKRISPTIEMIPLIDTMFLLLLFFICALLSVTSGISGKQLPVELPEVMQALVPEKDYSRLVVNSSQLFLDERPILLSELALLEKNKKIYVAADKNISYGRLAEVLSALSDAGLRKISLETK